MARSLKEGERAPRSLSRGAQEAGGIAVILKTLRKRARLTLKELAERSGISMSTVSKVENGLLSPGYETLQRLAVGLSVDVGDLFREPVAEASTGRRGVTLRGQGVKINTPRYTYEALASDVSRKRFLPLVGTIRARDLTDADPLPTHEGEELIYVMSGAVRLHSEHYEPLVLEPGDSVYIDSRSGHALTSCGIGDAVILWICSDQSAVDTAGGHTERT